ncbi:MAG TPA: hypothetical protein PK252_01105 [Bacteroidales bacterium]|mgnify:CR=1 FL=1|nr:hypothetical protein [Bacteroidales bacterium]
MEETGALTDPLEDLRKLLVDFKGEVNIINERIDVDLQVKYFDLSQKYRNKKLSLPEGELNVELLDDESADEEIKKILLIQLAHSKDVKSFRIIEKFVSQKHPVLYQWSLMALQEAQMYIQSDLLEQPQIFLCTGLGGRDRKLRYFIAFFNREGLDFTDWQQKTIKNEVELGLPVYDAELEDIQFERFLAKIILLIPIVSPIHHFMRDVINKINIFGNFVDENCIVTNVRILSFDEILQVANKKEDITDKL